jgi:pimeloyl-ACP methyl ester carboxylesterase
VKLLSLTLAACLPATAAHAQAPTVAKVGDLPTRQIPGFADRAYDEGARAFYIRGQMGDPAPEVAEIMRYCGPAPDLSAVKAPAFIYQGSADKLVTADTAERWKAQLPNVVQVRLYPG